MFGQLSDKLSIEIVSETVGNVLSAQGHSIVSDAEKVADWAEYQWNSDPNSDVFAEKYNLQ